MKPDELIALADALTSSVRKPSWETIETAAAYLRQRAALAAQPAPEDDTSYKPVPAKHVATYVRSSAAPDPRSTIQDAYANALDKAIAFDQHRLVVADEAQPAPDYVPLTTGDIARCMTMVSDPLLWGRMGDNCGVLAEEFARAVERAVRGQG